jgi:hypothetical protein
MRLKTAIKAFIAAWRKPKEMSLFLEGEKPEAKSTKADTSHLRLLSLLQTGGRLMDFFQEDLGGCTDAQLGAAARKIHQDCRATLEEYVTVRPVLEEAEGATVDVPIGYDVTKIKVVGNVKGTPPYKGTLVHGGWKAHKRSLPKSARGSDSEVLFPAEVEVR